MRTKRLRTFVLGFLAGAACMGAVWVLVQGGNPFAANRERDVQAEARSGRIWAEPLERAGLDNLHRVSPGLYRGAQPAAEGYAQLKAMGIKTVINLRKFHGESDEVATADLDYEHLTVNTVHPEDKEVLRFLQIAGDPARRPVFVHCQHGSDRTGLMCAVYRVAVEGWTKNQAIEEWTKGGFGFHGAFQTLLKYFKELDFDKLRSEAGLARTRPHSRPDGQ